MNLIIQPSTPGAPQPRPGAPAAGPAVAARGAVGVVGAGGGDPVAFSPAAVLLAQLQAGTAGTVPALPAPGSDQATALTALLAQRLGVLLREAGLPAAGPALAFEVGRDDRVRVVSSRPDAPQLQALMNAHADVQVLVRLLHAINAAPDAGMTTVTLPAPERRGERGDSVDAAAAPGPPLVHPWGSPGATRGPRTTHAGLRVWLAWLVAAVLAILGLLAWQ